MHRCCTIAVIATTALLVAGCSAERSGLAELRRLCEKDAGLAIYRTVAADGYYDAEKREGALRVLLGSDFRFIEFCNDKPGRGSLLDQPGCGRYTRVAKDSGRCDPRIDRILEESVIEPYVSFKENYCVEFERLERPEARYRYRSVLVNLDDSGDSLKFAMASERIVDADTDEILGTFITYFFDPNPPYSVPKSCANIGEEFPSATKANLVSKVIITSQGEGK